MSDADTTDDGPESVDGPDADSSNSDIPDADEPDPVTNPEQAVDAAGGGTDVGGTVDYAWVMRTTFVVTILVGAPLVTLLSIPVSLPTWNARAEFAVRVGAVVWFVTAIGVYTYAARRL